MTTAAQLRAGDRFRWSNTGWHTARRVEPGTGNVGEDLVRVYISRIRSADVAFAPTDPVEIAGRPIRVTVSCASPDEADAIAENLIARCLAAAVQHWPARSVYRWNDDVQRTAETVLSIETLDSHLNAVRGAIIGLHSCDTPSIWSAHADVDAHVREWLETSTAGE